MAYLHLLSNQTSLEPTMGLVLLAAPVPFAWIGAAATARRLRSAGLSPILTIGFFVPVANLVLFSFLVALPPASGESSISRLKIPRTVMISVAAVPVAAALLMGNIWVGSPYGLVSFTALPVLVGIISAFLHHPHGQIGAYGSSVSGILLASTALSSSLWRVFSA